MPRAECKLCRRENDLRNSHIIPAFAFRWLRRSAAGGHFRLGTIPNRRAQDGLKRYWLCQECENRLNVVETKFANQIFHPYLADSAGTYRYGQWLLRFCTSLSWRVLLFHRDEIGIQDWEPEALAAVNNAETRWRQFLLGRRLSPGPYQQHILPMDTIASATGDLAPNINRYLMRAIDMDICRGGDTIFTFTKIGRFMVFGFVRKTNFREWRGTRAPLFFGSIRPRDYSLPYSLIDYINGKALRMAEIMESVSEKQKQKIDDALSKNAERYVRSDAFSAFVADINMFGAAAFSDGDDSTNES